MKADPCAASISVPRLIRARTSDFVELTKPKLTSLVLFTTFVGFCTASQTAIPLLLLLHTLVGTALMSGGAGAFNMYKEQRTDSLMGRTALRPITAGRLQSRHALAFALLISVFGLVYLYVNVNPVTSFLSAVIFACYQFLYTPLKTKTWLSTFVGAFPGALPAIMGWTAAKGTVSTFALVLFAIVFLWQIPHFYAIGWMYRDEYARAGLPVLSVVDSSGQRTARQVVAYITVLIFVSLLPSRIPLAASVYPVGAGILGFAFLGYGLHFARLRDRSSARRLFLASAVYLPALLILLVLDRLAAR
jgi:heme o synthase